jgi:hypothetical protein
MHSVQGELDANGELIKVPVRIIRNSGRDGAVEVGTIMYLPVRSAICLVREGTAERIRTYAKSRERATRIAHERAALPE